MTVRALIRCSILLLLGGGLLCCGRTSSAQSVGHWEIVDQATSGTASASWTNTDGTTGSNSYDVGYPAISASGYLRAASAQITVTHDTTVAWLDDYGNPAPNPPAKLSLCIYADTNGSASGATSVYAEANDGLGDPSVHTSDQTSDYADSQGRHLKTFDGSLGVVYLSDTMACSASAASSGYGDSLNVAVCNFSYSIWLDLRGVGIYSNLDTTYYEGPNYTRVANVRSPSGAMKGDTSALGYVYDFATSRTVQYDALVAGTFANGSHYHWWSAMTGQSGEGTFDNNVVPAFTVTYSDNSNQGHDGQEDYIHVHLIDAADGANAENIYRLHFHCPVSEWTRFTPNQTVPSSMQPTHDSHDGWTELGPFPNGGAQVGHETKTITTGSKVSVSGKVESTSGFTISEAGVSLAFSQNESVENGHEYSTSVAQSHTCDISGFSTGYMYWAWGTERRHGEFSGWGPNGYVGRQPWHLDTPQLLAGEPQVVWGYYEESTQ